MQLTCSRSNHRGQMCLHTLDLTPTPQAADLLHCLVPPLAEATRSPTAMMTSMMPLTMTLTAVTPTATRSPWRSGRRKITISQGNFSLNGAQSCPGRKVFSSPTAACIWLAAEPAPSLKAGRSSYLRSGICSTSTRGDGGLRQIIRRRV
jgi:hypothetical protein